MNSDFFLKELEQALDRYDFQGVDDLTDKVDPAGFSEKQIKKTLSLIRRKGQFPLLEKTASLFVASGNQTPLIRRQWAQAVLDQNRVNQGLSILRILDAQVQEDDPEKPEIRGLIGRGFKQCFVNEGGASNLQAAIEAYGTGWRARQGDYRWHGINLVALLKRAERDHIPVVHEEAANDVARNILQEIQDLENPHVWDYGTAMEASVALGNKEEALKWGKQYVRHPQADAFELGSTLRQLREIWQFSTSDIGQALEPVIEYELLQRKGGSVAFTKDRLKDDSGFQAVYGPEGYIHVEWLENLFKLFQSVARVRHTTSSEPFGTGFVVKGNTLKDTWGDGLVFVTNAHVVSDTQADHAPLRPDEACAEFTRLPGQPRLPLGPKRFHSPRSALDAWICDLSPSDALKPLVLSFYPPLVAQEGDKPQRIYVMGHPQGGDLVISLYNNDLVGYEGPYVHYKSPTEGGSSGSPVITRSLQTFALHHKTRERLQVNEGIVFEKIKEEITASMM